MVDQAEVLSVDQEAELVAKLEAIEQATTRQLVIATVNDLQGLSIEVYGYQLGRAWEIGQGAKTAGDEGEKDNGVVLIVAPTERKVRIEVGYGLEGVITDAIASRIIRADIVPKFKDGDLPGGIAAGTDRLAALLLEDGTGQVVPAAPFLEIEPHYEEHYDLLWEIELALEPYIPMLGAFFIITFILVTIISLIGAITGREEIMLFHRLEEAAWRKFGGKPGGSGRGRSSYRSSSFSSGFSSGGFSSGGFSGGSSFSGGGGSFGGGGASGSW